MVWDERKNFWRDPVDGRERVPHGSDQAEYLQRVLFENVDLKACVNDPAGIDGFPFRFTWSWSAVVAILESDGLGVRWRATTTVSDTPPT